MNEQREIVVVEVPEPTLAKGQILVQSAYSLISTGTELGTAGGQHAGSKKYLNLIRRVGTNLKEKGLSETVAGVWKHLQQLGPRFSGWGYSLSGVVLKAAEDVKDLRVGDRVACGGSSANHAEVIAVSQNLVVRLSEKVSLRDGCFTTLGAIAMQGVHRANVTFGETIVVVGVGLVGQLVSQLLQVAGCYVIAVDLLEERLSLARSLGAHYVIHAGSEDPVRAVHAITGDQGADAVILCAATASDEPVNQAFRMCRERGRVVVVGDIGMNLERTHFYQKEIDLLISRSYGPGRYDYEYEQLGLDYPIGYVRWTENRNMVEFVQLLAAAKVRVGPLISAEYTLARAAQAYRDLAEKPKEILAAVFRYDSTEPIQDHLKAVHLRRSVEQKPGKVRIAVIGAGSFARAYHLPNLRRLSNCEVAAVVNTTGPKVRQVAQEFDAAYCTTDYREVLGDKDIDAVLIATPHHLHAEIAIAAAEKGKHIFVEKPMGLTLEECRQVCQAVADAGVLLTVGFNRRFAPLARELKQLLVTIPNPKIFLYRVNAGWLSPDHWLLDPVRGGGRILGECCHFFDLLYFLTGAEPRRISACQARAPKGQESDPANMSISLEFADGSVGTLLYTVAGHSGLAKERLEVFAGGKAFILDDFASLSVYGLNYRGPSRLPSSDKGHAQLLRHFVDAIVEGRPLEITAQDGLRATLCGLKSLEAAQTGSFLDVNNEHFII